jgi:hypothetical protein
MRRKLTCEEKWQVARNLFDQAKGEVIGANDGLCPATMAEHIVFHLDLDAEFDLGFEIGRAKVRERGGRLIPFSVMFFPRNDVDDPTSSEFSTMARPTVISKDHRISEYIEDASYYGSSEISTGQLAMVLVTSEKDGICFATYVRFGDRVIPFCAQPIGLKVVAK